MEIGLIGLGRMGANLVRRLTRAGHHCVVFDTHAETVAKLAGEGATGATSLAELVRELEAPRAVWLMLPVAAVEQTLATLKPLLAKDDIVIDGGNSHYRDDIRRARDLREAGIHYIDAGTSGGIWGLEEGYCLMLGGEDEPVRRLGPVFAALAPGADAAPRTEGRTGEPAPAEQGWLHCGANGAGHFVKMVHNGIEYGIMQAYAEGLNILAHADAGDHPRAADAETAPLSDPDAYRYRFPLADVAEVWRRGSVIRSWLLDLGAEALLREPAADGFRTEVADSGEGRWTVQAAIDTSCPAPVLSAALQARFNSRGESAFADRFLSALRDGFGGHGGRVTKR